MWLKIVEKFREWKRVMSVARKPDKDEFLTSAKICALGITIIGIIGFVIFLIFIFTGI
ncbi:MAG: protein translocase SEC61 complex subunit gamma [Candidatus Aenigmatarchaeota archaeon]